MRGLRFGSATCPFETGVLFLAGGGGSCLLAVLPVLEVHPAYWYYTILLFACSLRLLYIFLHLLTKRLLYASLFTPATLFSFFCTHHDPINTIFIPAFCVSHRLPLPSVPHMLCTAFIRHKQVTAT